MIYVPILGIIKISIMIFLFRLSGHKLGVKRTIQGLVVIIIAVTTVNQFMVTFQCLPVASIWNREAYPNAKCVDFNKVTTGFASIGVITDVLALILPTWIVYDLKIARKQKLMLIGILSFGLMYVHLHSSCLYSTNPRKYHADSSKYRHIWSGSCRTSSTL